MSSILEERIQKFNNLLKGGQLSYPARVQRTHTAESAKIKFDQLTDVNSNLYLVGRVKLVRKHGKACFIDLEDFSGKIQVYFRADDLGDKSYQTLTDNLDLGDFIEVRGFMFLTKMGEKTLHAKEWKLLAKNFLPLPEKWHGLVDPETRYRQRYLDLISNKDIREIFLKRSQIINGLREFFNSRGYIEVDTPILQSLAGGATARPFKTHHNALDLDLYLRIAPELFLKRLLVGGFEKVYEIARCFRNEGIDWAHNPEFTQIEFYEAYKDYQYLMSLTEELIIFLFNKLKLDFSLSYRGQKINFQPPYPRITFRESLMEYADLDLESMKNIDDTRAVAKSLNIAVEKNWDYANILDAIFKEKVRAKIIDPVFITDYPIELSPLAKRKEDNPYYVERFQLLVAGLEVCNAFSELNDPFDQKERFLKQEESLKLGNEEAQHLDEDFIKALEYGMPPAAGEGIGVDR
jgi:lysyl-tRNA synthetase class 2